MPAGVQHGMAPLRSLTAAIPRVVRAAAAVALLCGIGIASSARATTTYTLDAGTIVLTIDEYSPSDGRLRRAADPVSFAIDSATVTLDPDLLAVDLLQLGASPQIELALYPNTYSATHDAYSTLVVEALSLSAVAGEMLPSGGYAFDSSVDVDLTFGGTGGYGSYGGHDAVSLLPARLGPGRLYSTIAPGESISLSGSTTGLFQSPYNDSRFVVTATFRMTASPSSSPVPEPGAAMLFLSGLGVAALAARPARRRLRQGVS